MTIANPSATIPLFNSDGTPTTTGLRLLQSIASALNGSTQTVSGQTISAFGVPGGATIYCGALASPNGLVAANIGDLFLSTLAGDGMFFKKTGSAGSQSGWSKVTMA